MFGFIVENRIAVAERNILCLLRPFWLSPRQVMVVPVSPKFDDYASQVHKQLHDAGLMADVDTAPGDSFNKKIRNAQLYHYNFIMGMNDITHCLPNAVGISSYPLTT